MSIDCTKMTPDEKEQLFGRAFREIPIISFESIDGEMSLIVILDGREVNLIGDPEECLRVYTGGTQQDQTKQ